MKVYVVIDDVPQDRSERNVIGVARDIDGAKLIADAMRDERWTWHEWEQVYDGCLRCLSSSFSYQEIQEWDLV